MANEKEKTVKESPCEKYVVEELISTKKELMELKQDYQDLSRVYHKLVELVRLGTKPFRVVVEDKYTSIYYQDRFIALESSKDLKDIDKVVALIYFGQGMLEREE